MKELEALVAHHLARLPLPRAPLTLLPRVMAAAEAWMARPWYQRAWFTWPIGWQAAAVVLVAAMAAAGADILSNGWLAAAGVLSSFTAGPGAPLERWLGELNAGVTTARVVWSTLVEPLLPYLFTVVCLMCAACAAGAVAFSQVVLGRMTR
jgi:hypothetical protein